MNRIVKFHVAFMNFSRYMKSFSLVDFSYLLQQEMKLLLCEVFMWQKYNKCGPSLSWNVCQTDNITAASLKRKFSDASAVFLVQCPHDKFHRFVLVMYLVKFSHFSFPRYQILIDVRKKWHLKTAWNHRLIKRRLLNIFFPDKSYYNLLLQADIFSHSA